jgi:hypothetical protein
VKASVERRCIEPASPVPATDRYNSIAAESLKQLIFTIEEHGMDKV